MELYCHEVTPGLSYARIGYHYARPGTMDDCEPLMPEDLRFLQLPENWQPVGKKGSANAIFYTAEDIMEGKKEPSQSSLTGGLIQLKVMSMVWSVVTLLKV